MGTQTHGTVGGLDVEGLPAWQLARRERILDAGLRALTEQEYEQIQIREVAAGADVALGTLYRYFSSKEHLYAAVLHDWSASGRNRPARTRRAPGPDAVRARMHAVIRAFERQPQFYKVHMVLQSSTDENVKPLIARIAAAELATLAELFGTLGPGRAGDAALMPWSIVNTMLVQAIYHGGSMAEVHRIADQFVDLLVPEFDPALAR